MNQMNHFSLVIVAIICCFLVIKADNATNQTQSKTDTKSNDGSTNTSSSTTTTEKPKPIIKVSTSELCKKCHCDIDKKLLECKNLNLTSWFNNNEWNTIENGDIQFETINMSGNNLEYVPIFPELLSLKNLLLNYNQIKTINETAFKNLQKLEILDLSHNRLTSKELTPGVFEGRYSATRYEPLGNMKELYLGYNELHTLDPDIFEHFSVLECLSLNGNVFQVLDQMTQIAIGSLTNLKSLDLSYMELDTIPEHLFHAPRQLEKLFLTGNLLKELPTALNYAINLRSLYLDENPLKNIEGENVFPNLKKLEILSLTYLNHINQFGKGAFSGLQNLKEFYATNNPHLINIHPSAFARPVNGTINYDYPPLEKIYLHNNNLTVLSKALLERWDKVNVIDIRMNPWKCDTDNDFLIHDLYPQILSNTPTISMKIKCGSPSNYKGIEIHDIYEKKKALRAPDLYGNHPENDGAVLIGMLIGVIIGIPLAFGAFIIYKRGCFGLIKRPLDYGGALYKRADFEDYY